MKMPPINTFFADTVLQNIIQLSLKHNLDLMAANSMLYLSKGDWQLSRNSFLPFVDLNLSGGKRRFGEHTMDGVGNYDTNFSPNIDDSQKMTNPLDNYQVGFRASWELDLWGKIRHQAKGSRYRYMAEFNQVNWLKTQLVSETAALYFEIQGLKEMLIIADSNIALQENALVVATINMEAGRLNMLAVEQFQAQVHRTKALKNELERRLTQTKSQLFMLISEYPGSKLDSLPPAQPISWSWTENGVPAQWLQKRPDIIQSGLEFQATGSDIKAARAAFFPQLVIHPQIGFESFNAEKFLNPTSLAWTFIGGLTAPIFYQKQLRVNHKKALARNEAAFYRYKKSIMGAYNEVYMLLEWRKTLEEERLNKEKEVESLEEAVTIANQLFTNGYATYLEVIMAQNNVLASKLELVQVYINQNRNHINLYRALGGGW